MSFSKYCEKAALKNIFALYGESWHLVYKSLYVYNTQYCKFHVYCYTTKIPERNIVKALCHSARKLNGVNIKGYSCY